MRLPPILPRGSRPIAPGVAGRALYQLGVAAAILLAISPAPIRATDTVGNDIYEVHVQSQVSGDGGQFGSWNAVTASAHPAGGGRDILYRNLDTTKNFSSLRLYELNGTGFVDYTFGGRGPSIGPQRNLDTFLLSEGESPLAASGRGRRTEWLVTERELRIAQDVLVVGQGVADSAIYHTVEIENLGDAPVRIGWRNLYDWSLFGGRTTDDRPFNSFEPLCGSVTATSTTRDFLHSPVIADWVRVFVEGGDYEPLLALRFDPGFRPDLPVTTPDEYVYANWTIAYNQTAFDYPLSGPLDDSAGLSWFGRTAERAREIAPGASARFTQVLFAMEPGGCPAPCMATDGERILCTTDGSGDYRLRFRVENRSGGPIHHLFLVDPPDHLVVDPDHLTFADEPGGFLADGATSREKTVTIGNGLPGDAVTFRFSLHDALFEECCAVEHTIVLPECECAQIERGGFGCTILEGTPVFSYKFTLQNLEDRNVEYILASPETQGITVLQDPGLPGPLGPGEETKELFQFFGPGAPLGGEACFRISTHDSLFEECCSIQECVDLPTSCHDPGINLNTGYDELNGVELPAPANDDDWRVLQPPAPAKVVSDKVVTWTDPFPDARWISVQGERGRSLPGQLITGYERCFCLAGTGGDVALSLALFADDRAEVFLNGLSIAGPGGGFRASNRLDVQRSGTVGDGLFLAGENCLVVEVEDSGKFVTGLLLQGRVESEDGACPQ